MAEMCRKLETETEKVLPFYASSLTPEEDEDVAAAMQEAPSESLAEVLYKALWSLHDWAFVHYAFIPLLKCSLLMLHFPP